MPSKHFTNTLLTNIALFVSENDFQFHEYHIAIRKLLKSGSHGSKHIALDRNGILAFWIEGRESHHP